MLESINCITIIITLEGIEETGSEEKCIDNSL